MKLDRFFDLVEQGAGAIPLAIFLLAFAPILIPLALWGWAIDYMTRPPAPPKPKARRLTTKEMLEVMKNK